MVHSQLFKSSDLQLDQQAHLVDQRSSRPPSRLRMMRQRLAILLIINLLENLLQPLTLFEHHWLGWLGNSSLCRMISTFSTMSTAASARPFSVIPTSEACAVEPIVRLLGVLFFLIISSFPTELAHDHILLCDIHAMG